MYAQGSDCRVDHETMALKLVDVSKHCSKHTESVVCIGMLAVWRGRSVEGWKIGWQG